MNLKQILDAADYRMAGGEPYQWNCYGDYSHYLDIADVDGNVVANAIYDCLTQEIYEAVVSYYGDTDLQSVCYRWTASPEYVRRRQDEAKSRNVDDTVAWDEIKYTDLETEEDFLEKLTAILNHEDFDRRVQVPLDLSNDELLTLFKQAHERDMTFNDYMAEVLEQALRTIKDQEKQQQQQDSSKWPFGWPETTTKPVGRKRDSKGRFVKS